MFGFLAGGALLALFLIWAAASLITDMLKVVYYGLYILALLVARAWQVRRRQRSPASHKLPAAKVEQASHQVPAADH